MEPVINGGTVWGDQFARIVLDHGIKYPTLYEIGAFNGEDAKLFSEVIPGAHVYMFEASQQSFNEYLKDKPNTYNVAIGNYTGKAKFYVSGEAPISSLYKPRGFMREEEVNIYRLEDFVEEFKIPKPTVVKIDVEGACLEVLEGMGDLLDSVEILYIETEDKPYWEGQKLHNDVLPLLKDYKCILMHDNGGQRDSIWLK